MFIGLPSNFDTPVKQVITYRSEVTAGRIARFTPTRLCCSQVLLIQNLFQALLVGKKLENQLSLVGAYAPSPALHLSGLSSISQKGNSSNSSSKERLYFTPKQGGNQIFEATLSSGGNHIKRGRAFYAYCFAKASHVMRYIIFYIHSLGIKHFRCI